MNPTQSQPGKKTRKRAKLPRAIIIRGLHGHSAVIPRRTKAEAQAACRWANLSWEEKRKVVMDAIRLQSGYAWEQATAVLSALGERPERGGGET